MARVDPTQRRPPSSVTGEVLSHADVRGREARVINGESSAGFTPGAARSKGEEAAKAPNFTGSGAAPGANSANQDQNPNEGKNAFEGMVDKGRAAVDKAGNTLMMGAAGLGAFLYLVLGWRTLAVVLGGGGMGLGYLLKSKVAKIGEKGDLDTEVVKHIKAMKLSPEQEKRIFEFLNQELSATAYANPNAQDFSNRAKEAAFKAANQAASFVKGSMNGQGTKPAAA